MTTRRRRWLKRGSFTSGAVVLVLAVVFVVGTHGCASLGAAPDSDELARMKASPHYRDGKFHNFHAPKPVDTADTLSRWFGPEMRTPSCPLPLYDKAKLLEAWQSPPSSGLRITWLGH
ncbi:MAG TPA: hypothetical protein VGO62_04500, partial [Myxococcota bacterium]